MQVALLRAVNVGGAGKLAMGDLRACCEGLGFADVRTLLQSGNVVFKAGALNGAALEQTLEAALEAILGLKTEVFVRDGAELGDIVAANPFPAFAKKDPSHLVVVFMKKATGAADRQAIAAATKRGPEEAKAHGRQVYITYSAGIGRSTLKLPVEGTARNWNTVTKLAAMAAGA
jgi:uncharacterized protein (DUF1697 family)